MAKFRRNFGSFNLVELTEFWLLVFMEFCGNFGCYILRNWSGILAVNFVGMSSEFQLLNLADLGVKAVNLDEISMKFKFSV